MSGVNPKEYRKSDSDFGLRNLEAITAGLVSHLRRGGIDMKPRYETRGDFYVTYGICKEIWRDNQIQDHFNYYAGVEVKKGSVPPQGMELIFIPEQKYAVFTHRGGLKDLSLTNQYIWGTWMPQSGYELAPASDLEIYPAAFEPDNNESEMELWIPLTKVPDVLFKTKPDDSL